VATSNISAIFSRRDAQISCAGMNTTEELLGPQQRNARRAEDEFFGIQNSRKAYLACSRTSDPANHRQEAAMEKTLRDGQQ